MDLKFAILNFVVGEERLFDEKLNVVKVSHKTAFATGTSRHESDVFNSFSISIAWECKILNKFDYSR